MPKAKAKKKPQHHRPRIEKPMLVNRNKLEVSIASFNQLAIWQGLIEFSSIDLCAHMIVLTTTEKIEIHIPIAEAFNFAKCQAIIATATGIGIPKPPYGQLYEWEDAMLLALKIARKNGGAIPSSTPPIKEEIREYLDIVWRAAGKPRAHDDKAKFMRYMRMAKNSRRDPGAKEIAPSVFNAEGFCWVHAPSFRNWLSVASVCDRRISFAEVRNGLTLLGFVYQENVTKGSDGDEECACLWCGPQMYD